MHDEVGIAFDLRRIGVIVMDAMAVEGERGIAEQQGRRGRNRDDDVVGVVARGDGRRGRACGGRRRLAIDDIHLLPNGDPALGGDLVQDLDEAEASGPARLERNVLDLLAARDAIPGLEHVQRFDRPARPHAARQVDRRQEAALGGMAVGPERVGGRDVGGETPVETGRRLAASRDDAMRCEGRAEFAEEPRRDHIGNGAFASDPGADIRARLRDVARQAVLRPLGTRHDHAPARITTVFSTPQP